MEKSAFTERPFMKALKQISVVWVGIPFTVLACIAFGGIVRYTEHPNDALASESKDQHPAEMPAPSRPATLIVESEAGRAVIYADTTTGARVLCAVGSTCVLLPAAKQQSR